jgi:hypothetical protein
MNADTQSVSDVNSLAGIMFIVLRRNRYIVRAATVNVNRRGRMITDGREIIVGNARRSHNCKRTQR